MAKTPQEIREAELPKALRGFDEDATRQLLGEAAASLTAASRERDDLRRQVEELQKTVSASPSEAELIGRVLLTANHVAEDLLEKARAEAASIRRDAEAQRDDLFERAQLQADARVAEANARVEVLRAEDASLQRSISEHRQELVTFLRGALDRLDELHPLAGKTAEQGLDGALLAQLPSE
jgi:cell division septum initiation protein DivIVA